MYILLAVEVKRSVHESEHERECMHMFTGTLTYVCVLKTKLFTCSVPAKIVSSGSSTVHAPLTGRVVLPCQVEGSPVPTLLWLKNRAVLKESASKLP